MTRQADLFHFLDTMPHGKTYRVTPEDVEIIKDWMRDKPFDGGVNFNSDFTKIYKFEVPEIKEKKTK